MTISRRGFIFGMATLLCAPAIVRASSIMERHHYCKSPILPPGEYLAKITDISLAEYARMDAEFTYGIATMQMSMPDNTKLIYKFIPRSLWR